MAEEDERNRLTGRIRRYTRVGTAVGGLAARLAGERYLGAYLFDDLVEGSDDEWLASLDG